MAFNERVEVPLDVQTGLCTYKGQVYTYHELMRVFDEEDLERADFIHETILAHPEDGLLNVWGTKENHYTDDWYYRYKPIRRKRNAYPRDTY